MSELGQKRHFDSAAITSGLPPKADDFRAAALLTRAILELIHRINQALLFDHLISARQGQGNETRAASRGASARFGAPSTTLLTPGRCHPSLW
jgi:hypothetical protein